MENYLVIELVVILTKRHDIYHEMYMYVYKHTENYVFLFLILFPFPLFFYSFALVTFRSRFIHFQVGQNIFYFFLFCGL